MKTFFTVKFALLPIAIFVFLIVRGMPAAAIGAGFIVALIVCAWRLYARDIKMLEIAALAIFSALAAGMFLARDVVVRQRGAVGVHRARRCFRLRRSFWEGPGRPNSPAPRIRGRTRIRCSCWST